MRWCTLGLLGLLGWACSSGPHELRVDLRTDLVPGAEFDSVVVELDGEVLSEQDVDTSADYLAGSRVLSTLLAKGDHSVSVSLLRGTSNIVDRSVTLQLNGDIGVTVVLTRDCRGVACPEEEGDVNATQCLAGRCVVPECAPETPELCGEAECMAAEDCTGTAGCGTAQCSAGTCLYASDSSGCTGDAYCDPNAGCRDRSFIRGPRVESDGDIVILGYALSGAARVGERTLEPIGEYDLYLEARSADGTSTMWTRDLQTARDEWLTRLRVAPDGRVLMAGVIEDGSLFEEDGFEFPGVSGRDLFFAKLEPTTGVVSWANVAHSDESGLNVVGIDADENERVAVVVEARSGTLGSVTFQESENVLPTLVMLDADAMPLWSVPMDDDFEVHAVATQGNSTYVIGCTHGEVTIDGVTAPATGKDGLIARIDDVAGTPEVVWLELFDATSATGFHDGVLDDAGVLHVVADYNTAASGFGIAVEAPPNNRWNGLIMGINPDATTVYALPFGGAQHDQLTSIERRAGTLLIGGTGVGPFDVGGTSMPDGGRRAFVLEVDEAGTPMRIEGIGTGGREAWDVALSTTARCAFGEANAQTEPPFYRGREDTLYFDCLPR